MTTYSVMDVLMASPTEPLPEFKRRHQLTIMLDALRNLEQAPEPTNQDWDRVNNAVLMMEALLNMGYVEDPDGLLEDAIEALGKAGASVVKSQVRLPNGPLKTVGEFPVNVAPHTDVVVEVTVKIVAEVE